MRPIGYYVHHQGAGHWQAGCRLVPHLRHPVTLIGTFAETDTSRAPAPLLDLPDDRLASSFDARDGAADRPEGLHYAPVGHVGIRGRMTRLARWVAENDPALIVVDVSVEIAIFARLLSVPTAVVRLAGLRTDPPHLEAFRAAERLIAPFPALLDDPEMPGWVRDKTYYAGLLAAPPPPSRERGRDIVVVLGRGGEPVTARDLAAAARAVPERPWQVLGRVAATDGVELPPNLVLNGWVDDVAARIASAALVVGAAGDGVLASVAASGAPFLCLPEPRPHEEQVRKARALARLGAAVVHEGWPAPPDWASLVGRALALDPAQLAALVVPDAVPRLAAEIDRLADAAEVRERR